MFGAFYPGQSYPAQAPDIPAGAIVLFPVFVETDAEPLTAWRLARPVTAERLATRLTPRRRAIRLED